MLRINLVRIWVRVTAHAPVLKETGDGGGPIGREHVVVVYATAVARVVELAQDGTPRSRLPQLWGEVRQTKVVAAILATDLQRLSGRGHYVTHA